jgi:hypothetical protein
MTHQAPPYRPRLPRSTRTDRTSLSNRGRVNYLFQRTSHTLTDAKTIAAEVQAVSVSNILRVRCRSKIAPPSVTWCSAVRRDGSCSGQGPSKRGAGWPGRLGIYRPHTRERPPLAAAGKHVSWTNVIRSALPCLVAKSMRQSARAVPQCGFGAAAL